MAPLVVAVVAVEVGVKVDVVSVGVWFKFWLRCSLVLAAFFERETRGVGGP